jgi:hypothetical protein
VDKSNIEQAIKDGPEAVEKLIQAETDRRVTSAREKWEKDLPQAVDDEIKARQDREKQQAEKRLRISEEIGAHFEGSNIDAETWGDMIDIDGLMDLEDSERTAKIEQTAQHIRTALERVLKEKYRSKTPAGTDENAEVNEDAAFKAKLLEKMR